MLGAREDALRSYQWPDADDPRICGKINEKARDYPGGETFLAGSHRDTLWEKSYMLVGSGSGSLAAMVGTSAVRIRQCHGRKNTGMLINMRWRRMGGIR